MRLPIARDADGLVTAVGAARINRDEASGAVRRIDHGRVAEQREYDRLGRLSALHVTVAKRHVYALNLTRDQSGRVTERRERLGERGARTTAMHYDEGGQLDRVLVDGRVAERYVY